ALHRRESRMCTAPAPTSKDGSGNHMPFRAKMPMLGITPDLVKPGLQFCDSSVAHQYGWSELIAVKENSVENWKPLKPSVSAGSRFRGAKTTPSSEANDRKSWLSGMTWPFDMWARRARTRSLSSARATRVAHITTPAVRTKPVSALIVD